jgi:hypothetical protein
LDYGGPGQGTAENCGDERGGKTPGLARKLSFPSPFALEPEPIITASERELRAVRRPWMNTVLL